MVIISKEVSLYKNTSTSPTTYSIHAITTFEGKYVANGYEITTNKAGQPVLILKVKSSSVGQKVVIHQYQLKQLSLKNDDDELDVYMKDPNKKKKDKLGSVRADENPRPEKSY